LAPSDTHQLARSDQRHGTNSKEKGTFRFETINNCSVVRQTCAFTKRFWHCVTCCCERTVAGRALAIFLWKMLTRARWVISSILCAQRIKWWRRRELRLYP